MDLIVKSKLFEGGQLFFTEGVNNLIAENIDFSAQVCKSLKRHLCGDWGDLEAEDKITNADALKNGDRIFSAYNGVKRIWIITEADRSSTTVLLPSEY
ncbi:MAG: hypothetical protein PHQ00_05475 [Phycisphaerae bacterium]|nr:hypothetical protein [Phycisphaerae bacterium]